MASLVTPFIVMGPWPLTCTLHLYQPSCPRTKPTSLNFCLPSLPYCLPPHPFPLQAPGPLVPMQPFLASLIACPVPDSHQYTTSKAWHMPIAGNLLIWGLLFFLTQLAGLCRGLSACARTYARHSCGFLTTVSSCAEVSSAEHIHRYSCTKRRSRYRTCIKCLSVHQPCVRSLELPSVLNPTVTMP